MKENPLNESATRTLRNLMTPQTPPPPSGILRVADLFCGDGRFATAARDLGLEIVFAVESELREREIYELSHDVRPLEQMPRLFDGVPGFDILAVSIPGGSGILSEVKRKGSPYQEAARLIRVRRPRGVVIRGLSEEGANHALHELNILGYGVSFAEVGEQTFACGVLGWASGPTPELVPSLESPFVSVLRAVNIAVMVSTRGTQ